MDLEGKGYLGFITAKVFTPTETNIPVLPILHEGKLTFPVGFITGT